MVIKLTNVDVVISCHMRLACAQSYTNSCIITCKGGSMLTLPTFFTHSVSSFVRDTKSPMLFANMDFELQPNPAYDSSDKVIMDTS